MSQNKKMLVFHVNKTKFKPQALVQKRFDDPIYNTLCFKYIDVI